MLRQFSTGRHPISRRGAGWRPGLLAWSLAVGLAAGGLLGPPASPGTASGRSPDVLLLVLDTLRADHVGPRPDGTTSTPFLDSIAERSTVFRNAYSTTSWTLPSVVTMWTSTHQLEHGVTDFTSTLAPSAVTLAETLHARGYRTAGFSANPIVRPQLGVTRGFETWQFVRPVDMPDPGPDAVVDPDELFTKTRAPLVSAAALRWLDGVAPRERAGAGRAPFLLHLQFMEPHLPYGPPRDLLIEAMARSGNLEAKLDAALLRVDPDSLNPIDVRTRELVADLPYVGLYCPVHPAEDYVQAVALWGRGRSEIDPAVLQRDSYDAEVRSLDRDLRALFDALATRGLLDDLVVVVVADHGEALDDHGRSGHGYSLYEEVVRVPLIVHRPAQQGRRDVDEVTSLLGLAPTILALTGTPVPAAFRGRALAEALAPALRSEWPADEAFMDLPRRASEPAHLLHRRGLVRGSDKLLETRDGRKQIFHLRADPHELAPAAVAPGDAGPLPDAFARAAALADQGGAGRPTPGAAPLDASTRERLRALGYVH